MTPKETIYYHADLWPDVCKAQGWKKSDRQLRLDHITVCLLQIIPGFNVDTEVSSKSLTRPQVTALFTFLRHLANPNDIDLVQRWEDCKADYIAFHNSKIADWHQEQAFKKGGGRRLINNRFKGRPKAEAGPFEEDALDRKQASDRLMTMRRLNRQTNPVDRPF